MRVLLLAIVLVGQVWADARYELAYAAKTNSILQLVAGIAGIGKMTSAGEEVLLKGSRIMVKGEKQTILVNYADGTMVLIDHTDQTFENLKIEEMRERIAADIPNVLVEGLKRLFPGGGGGTATEVSVERKGDAGRYRSIKAFQQKHGLGYLLPGMESVISLMPSVEREIGKVKSQGDLVEAMRIQVGEGGRLVDAAVEIKNYRESAVEESELRPPLEYSEVK